MRLQTALRAIYPAECLLCASAATDEFGICPSCWPDVPFIFGTQCGQCGVPLPGQELPDERLTCDDCLAVPRPWKSGTAAMLYSDLGRKLVLGMKHGDRADIARAAGPWLWRACSKMLADVEPTTITIVPIPLHPWRLIQRRFNQSGLLAQALGKASGLPVLVDALRRPKPTPSLGGLDLEERMRILNAAIAPNPKRLPWLKGRSVLLVDDVMTSGATFAAATHALKDAEVENVYVIALARAARDT